MCEREWLLRLSLVLLRRKTPAECILGRGFFGGVVRRLYPKRQPQVWGFTMRRNPSVSLM